jgi:hypothetical protein
MEIIGPLDPKSFASVAAQKRLNSKVTSTIAASLGKPKPGVQLTKKTKPSTPKISEPMKTGKSFMKSKHQPMPGIDRPESSRGGTPISSPASPKILPEDFTVPDYKSFEFEWFSQLEASVLAFRRVTWADDSLSCNEVCKNAEPLCLFLAFTGEVP